MNKKNLFVFLGYLIFIILIGIFLYFISPQEIINKIGITNSYILVFIISLFGGFSSWTSFSMVALLITLVTGGMNLLFLGIIAGIGLSIGDLTMLFASSKGRKLITGKYDKLLLKFSIFLKEKVEKLIFFIIYIYIGLTPFPNDMLLISLGLIDYPKKKMYLPIILADITFPIVATYLSLNGLILFS